MTGAELGIFTFAYVMIWIYVLALLDQTYIDWQRKKIRELERIIKELENDKRQ